MKRRKSIENSLWKKVLKTDTCWNWQGKTNKYGYGLLSITDYTKRSLDGSRWSQKEVRAHRISWEITKGSIDSGLCVCHKCDNRLCVNPDHLFLGTPAENAADMVTKGRGAKGEKVAHPGESNPAAKLTAIEVQEIRNIYSTQSYSQAELGRRYGVTQAMISKIVQHRAWIR